MLTGFEPEVEQTVKGVPAVEVASAANVNVLVEVTSAHPEFEAVRVKVTLPAVISAVLGV